MAAVTICRIVQAQSAQEEKKNITASTFSPSICQEGVGPDVMTLVFFNVEL